MANSVTHAALPFPVKGARYTIAVPYLDADGDPTDPTTPDTERSIDAAAFADCTEEVTTISGSNGVGYITLTGDEMNGSMIAVAAKVASGPKATLATLYPRVLGVVTTGTAQAGAAGTITLASGAPAYDLTGCIVKTTGGTGGGGGSGSLNNQARVITAYNTSTKVATVEPNWETTPDNTTTYTILQTDMRLPAAASVGLATNNLDTQLTAIDDYLDTEVAAIKAKTDNLPSDPADASDIATSFTTVNTKLDTIDDFLDTEIAAIKAKTDNLPSDPADASDIASSFTTVNTKLDTIDDFLDTEVAAIKAKTDNLPSDPADQSAVEAAITAATSPLATAAALAVVDGIVDDILVDTGTTLQAELDGIQADTEDIQSRLPAALASGNIKADVLAINGSTAAAARLALSAANMIPGTVDTTAFTATTTILESDDITEATADHYNGRLILFTSGALIGQVSEITDYALNGGRGRFTYTALTEAPANNDTFLLV